MRIAKWVSLIAVTALADPAAVTEGRKSELICHESGCYPRVFSASHEFRKVEHDQEIPAGLHVQLDVSTGERFAKLVDPNDHSGDVVVVDGDTGGIEVTPDTVPAAEVFSGATVLKDQDSTPHPPNKAPLPSGEREEFRHGLDTLVNSHGGSGSCSEELIGALDSLEELVHELEFGLALVERAGGVEALLSQLSSVEETCRMKAALVLGSALRNNANALSAVHARNLPVIPTLINHLAHEHTTDTVAARLIYALSAALGGSQASPESPGTLSHAQFADAFGHHHLAKRFDRESVSDDVRGRIASLVEDHVFGRAVGGGEGVLTDAGVWAGKFEDTLVSNKVVSPSAKSKLLAALKQATDNLPPHTYTPSQPFLNWLAQNTANKDDPLIDQYTTLRAAFGNPKASRKHLVDEL
ncbi:nucleotide exchange factor sil1 [Savitreella phatthalungensis]